MARPSEHNPADIAIVTVHGTGDTAPGPDGDKWFQRGAAFTKRLTERLAAQGITAEIVPHLWSGANSARGREDGARDLAGKIRRLAKTKGPVHVIGHSHGGNVADSAASMVGWRMRKRAKPLIAGISTVGTPFFKTKLGAAEAFGGIAFLGIMLLNILALLLGALIIAAIGDKLPGLEKYAADCAAQLKAVGEATTDEAIRTCATQKFESDLSTHQFVGAMQWILPITGALLIPPIFVAVRGAFRILRILRKQRADARIFSIYHPNDEAIAFLQRVEELPIVPFPRWAFWHSSRNSGIVWGVRIVLFFVLLSAALAIAYFSGVRPTDADYTRLHVQDVFGGTSLLEVATILFGAAIVLAPVLFGLTYVLVRAVRGLGFELVGRGWVNNSIAGALRGMAFGRDGDEQIGAVSTHSHTFGTRPYVVEGEVGERMRTGAATAAAALIEKYRWALFTVGPDTNGAVTRLSTDAMTWDSLIHTTYFDQPETADIIADYIAECVAKAKEERG